MSAARTSGTDLASSLRQNTFLTLKVRPAGGPRGTGGPGDPATGGHGRATATFYGGTSCRGGTTFYGEGDLPIKD